MSKRLTLLGLVAALFVGPSLAPAMQPESAPKPPTQSEADNWVKKVNESVKTGCSVIKASGASVTLIALAKKDGKLTLLGALLTAAGSACDETTKIIDKIASASDDKAKEKAAKEASSKLDALTKEIALVEQIKERTQQVAKIDLGVVDATLKQHTATPADVIKDKKAAIAKWKALAAALKQNVERLEERQKFLKAVIAGCDPLVQKVKALKAKVASFKANDKGVCDSIECLQNLQLQQLLDELPKLKKAAEEKLSQLEPVLKDEQTRHKNLKANLKDLFGESVD